MTSIKDITDFRDQLGADTLKKALSENRQPITGGIITPLQNGILPPITNGAALLRQDPKEPPQLIKGLLHQGSKMVLGGGSKSYKTWGLTDLGLSVANGQPWWGFETTKAKVLYINLEIPEWSFAKRIDEIQISRPELSNLANFDVWNLRGFATAFEEMLSEMCEKAGMGYGLIIIDPIYKVYGNRDENSAGDMAQLLNAIDALAVKTGAAVVFGAHFSKGNQAGKESMDRISGSGVFARDPDTILIMTKHEVEDTFTVEPILRNLKPVAPFCVQREHPLMVRNESLDPKKLKKPGFMIEQYPVGLLLKTLGTDELTNKQWQERTCKETGMSVRTFQSKLSEIKDDPTKLICNNGKWKAVTPILPFPPQASACADEKKEVQQCN